VTTAYQTPFPFTGKLEQVVVDVSGEVIVDKEAEMRAIMARQ
jgi:arylsulfatase